MALDESELLSATGARVYIGDPAWTHDSLDAFDAQLLDWEEVGLVESVPEFGVRWNTGTFTPVSDGFERAYKTNMAANEVVLPCARDGSDAGQIAAQAAAGSRGKYPVKIILGDEPDGVGAKPSRFYMWALVTSATVVIGGSQDTVRTNITLSFSSRHLWQGDAVEGT